MSTSHPTLEHLAEFAEDLLSAAESTAIEQHIPQCARCRASVAELSNARTLLAEFAVEPIPIPPEVAARLDEGLRHEAGARAAGAGVPTDRRRSASGRGKLARAFALVATIGVLAAGGGVVYQAIADRSSEPPDQQAAGSPTPEPPRGGFALRQPDDPAGIALSGSNFEGRVRSALQTDDREDGATTDAPDVTPSPPTDPTDAPTSGPFGVDPGKEPVDPETIQSCLAEAIGVDPDEMIDVAPATFEGEPAALVIIAGDDPRSVHAYVIDGCPESGEAVYDAVVTVE